MFLNSCYAHCQTGTQETWLRADSPLLDNKVIICSSLAFFSWFPHTITIILRLQHFSHMPPYYIPFRAPLYHINMNKFSALVFWSAETSALSFTLLHNICYFNLHKEVKLAHKKAQFLWFYWLGLLHKSARNNLCKATFCAGRKDSFSVILTGFMFLFEICTADYFKGNWGLVLRSESISKDRLSIPLW